MYIQLIGPYRRRLPGCLTVAVFIHSRLPHTDSLATGMGPDADMDLGQLHSPADPMTKKLRAWCLYSQWQVGGPDG